MFPGFHNRDSLHVCWGMVTLPSQTFMDALPRGLFREFLNFFFFIFPSFPAPENLQLAWLESCLGNFTKALTLIAKNDLKEWLIVCGGWWHKSVKMLHMQECYSHIPVLTLWHWTDCSRYKIYQIEEPHLPPLSNSPKGFELFLWICYQEDVSG